MKKLSQFIGLITLAAVVACSIATAATGSAGAAEQTAQKKEYVCPPCGCDNDNDVFDKPGSCPSCGMALVEKGALSEPPTTGARPVTRKNVAILVFNGVEIIDYTGPWEVFGGAGFHVYSVAEKAEPITTSMGMKVAPNNTLDDAPTPDIVVVPGGRVFDAQRSPVVLKWLRDTAEKAEIVMSVCNGAFILAKAGLLNGLTATTTARLIDGLAGAAPNIKVVHDQRFVDNGKIITTGGLSAGIDGAMHVVSRVLGSGQAQALALGLEYNWAPENGFVRPALADRRLPGPIQNFDGELASTQGDREHWEKKWMVTSAASAAEVLKGIDQTLKADGKWSRQDGKDSGPAKSLWKFTDEDGRIWSGVVAVQPVEGAANKFIASMAIARTNATAEPVKAPAGGAAAGASNIVVKEAWIQEPPGQRNTAAFMVIENHGVGDAILVSAQTDASRATELHKMELQNGEMSMHRVDGIKIPQASQVELKPGGYHLMLIGLTKEIRQGDEIAVRLRFANSTEQTVMVPVRKR